MASPCKIFWSEEAITNLRDILGYLTNKWTEKEVDNFRKKLLSQLELISTFPLMGPITSRNPNLRKSVMSKHTSIIYQMRDNYIRIVWQSNGSWEDCMKSSLVLLHLEIKPFINHSFQDSNLSAVPHSVCDVPVQCFEFSFGNGVRHPCGFQVAFEVRGWQGSDNVNWPLRHQGQVILKDFRLCFPYMFWRRRSKSK